MRPSLQFFNSANVSLGTFFVPSFNGNETFSFLGVFFPEAIVARVRVTNGTQVLAPGNTTPDLVVMDDFIFGEPVPEPSTWVMIGGGLLMLIGLRRAHRALT